MKSLPAAPVKKSQYNLFDFGPGAQSRDTAWCWQRDRNTLRFNRGTHTKQEVAVWMLHQGLKASNMRNGEALVQFRNGHNLFIIHKMGTFYSCIGCLHNVNIVCAWVAFTLFLPASFKMSPHVIYCCHPSTKHNRCWCHQFTTPVSFHQTWPLFEMLAVEGG